MLKITVEYLHSQRLSSNFPERFWSKVEKTDGCWIWKGSKHRSGHGNIGRGGRCSGNIAAHVASWVLNRGPVPNGMCVCHNCPNGDNPSCVNPDHLWIGTRAENNRDASQKGQNEVGEKRYNHKLDWDSVVRIRCLVSEGLATQKYLASIHGVHPSIISEVVNFKRWKRPF